jgi:magnesium transporter
VAFGSVAGSMLPFVLKAIRLDRATASALFVGDARRCRWIVISFSTALLVLSGALL